jgi:hypothetical protein
MCEVCRGRHRIYATTKRARRKLEKAAVASDQLDSAVNATVVLDANSSPRVMLPDAESSRWTQAPATTATANWDDGAIDPQLFSASVSPSTSSASAQNYMGLHLPPYPPVPYVSSTSSELAGALTLPVPASASTTSNVDDNPDSSRCRPEKSDGTIIQTNPTSPNTSIASGSGAEKKSLPYYSRSRLPGKSNEQEEENGGESDSDDDENDDEHQVTNIHAGDDSADGSLPSTAHVVDGPTRFCSVKGCKAVIPCPSSSSSLSLFHILI